MEIGGQSFDGLTTYFETYASLLPTQVLVNLLSQAALSDYMFGTWGRLIPNSKDHPQHNQIWKFTAVNCDSSQVAVFQILNSMCPTFGYLQIPVTIVRLFKIQNSTYYHSIQTFPKSHKVSKFVRYGTGHGNCFSNTLHKTTKSSSIVLRLVSRFLTEGCLNIHVH